MRGLHVVDVCACAKLHNSNVDAERLAMIVKNLMMTICTNAKYDTKIDSGMFGAEIRYPSRCSLVMECRRYRIWTARKTKSLLQMSEIPRDEG